MKRFMAKKILQKDDILPLFWVKIETDCRKIPKDSEFLFTVIKNELMVVLRRT